MEIRQEAFDESGPVGKAIWIVVALIGGLGFMAWWALVIIGVPILMWRVIFYGWPG